MADLISFLYFPNFLECDSITYSIFVPRQLCGPFPRDNDSVVRGSTIAWGTFFFLKDPWMILCGLSSMALGILV